MKPTIAIFDAREVDETYFTEKLGADWNVIAIRDGLDEDTVGQAAEAEVVAVHVSSQVTAEMMARMPKLKHVACRSTGYDNVDLDYIKEHNLTVSTVPSYGDETVAEYAIMLLLAVSRKLLAAVSSVQEGIVKPEQLMGHDLAGKTLGVIGTGRIGRRSIAIARAFNMNVIAYDPFPNDSAATELGYRYLPLDEVLKQADAFTLHAPATQETEHIFNADAFAKMKDGVIIINTARGTLIDTPSLIEAINSGKVGGAGLDVLEGEEFLQTAPELELLVHSEIDAKTRQVLAIDILQKLPTVVLTNHNAYNSAEALGRIRETTAANLRAWKDGQPQNLVKIN